MPSPGDDVLLWLARTAEGVSTRAADHLGRLSLVATSRLPAPEPVR